LVDKQQDIIGEGYNIRADFYRGKSVMHTPHIHSYYELYFCPENIAQRSVICGIEYEHKFPSAIISKPHTIHSMSCVDDGPTDFRRYVFYFNEELISVFGIKIFQGDITDGKMGVLFKLSQENAEYLERVINTVYGTDMTPSEEAQGIILSFLIERLYALAEKNGIVGVGTSSYYVQNAMKFIAEHYGEELDANRVAREFSVSRSKLDRDFKLAAGATPRDFIESCRINRAKLILSSDEDRSVAEIAAALGFTSENYFYRFFKKHTGRTPNEYRKKFQARKEQQ